MFLQYPFRRINWPRLTLVSSFRRTEAHTARLPVTFTNGNIYLPLSALFPRTPLKVSLDEKPVCYAFVVMHKISREIRHVTRKHNHMEKTAGNKREENLFTWKLCSEYFHAIIFSFTRNSSWGMEYIQILFMIKLLLRLMTNHIGTFPLPLTLAGAACVGINFASFSLLCWFHTCHNLNYPTLIFCCDIWLHAHFGYLSPVKVPSISHKICHLSLTVLSSATDHVGHPIDVYD